MSRHWTDDAATIAALSGQADAIEVAACRDVGGNAVEQCSRGERADMFSVYFHITPGAQQAPHAGGGAHCIADRDTKAEARKLAADLAMKHGIPIRDFT